MTMSKGISKQLKCFIQGGSHSEYLLITIFLMVLVLRTKGKATDQPGRCAFFQMKKILGSGEVVCVNRTVCQTGYQPPTDRADLGQFEDWICQPCQDGYFQNKSGYEKCSACTVTTDTCGAGKFLIRNCTHDTDGYCSFCKAKQFPSEMGCLPCECCYCYYPLGNRHINRTAKPECLAVKDQLLDGHYCRGDSAAQYLCEVPPDKPASVISNSDYAPEANPDVIVLLICICFVAVVLVGGFVYVMKKDSQQATPNNGVGPGQPQKEEDQVIEQDAQEQVPPVSRADTSDYSQRQPLLGSEGDQQVNHCNSSEQNGNGSTAEREAEAVIVENVHVEVDQKAEAIPTDEGFESIHSNTIANYQNQNDTSMVNINQRHAAAGNVTNINQNQGNVAARVNEASSSNVGISNQGSGDLSSLASGVQMNQSNDDQEYHNARVTTMSINHSDLGRLVTQVEDNKAPTQEKSQFTKNENDHPKPDKLMADLNEFGIGKSAKLVGVDSFDFNRYSTLLQKQHKRSHPTVKQDAGNLDSTFRNMANQHGYCIRGGTRRDGNCFFHAVVAQCHLHHVCPDIRHDVLRRKVVQHLQEHAQEYGKFSEDDFNVYLENMAKDGTWADDLVIAATARVLNCTIRIVTFSQDGQMTSHEHTGETEQAIFLLGHFMNHFEGLVLAPAEPLDPELRREGDE